VFILLLVLIAVLFGSGFHPLWWVVAAALIYGTTRRGRDRGRGRSRGGGFDPGDYRDYRDRRERWDRRYDRQNQARRRWEDRRDHEPQG
jgi:hypothetical protein